MYNTQPLRASSRFIHILEALESEHSKAYSNPFTSSRSKW